MAVCVGVPRIVSIGIGIYIGIAGAHPHGPYGLFNSNAMLTSDRFQAIPTN